MSGERVVELDGIVGNIRTTLCRCSSSSWALREADQVAAITAIEQLKEAHKMVQRAECMLIRLEAQQNIERAMEDAARHQKIIDIADETLEDL